MVKPVDLDYDPAAIEMCNVTVRMPVELREAVKRQAHTEMRPLAQAIRFALRQYVLEGLPEGTATIDLSAVGAAIEAYNRDHFDA